MADKILLPNGCSMSNPSVNPKNWKTGGKELLKKNWQIQYYFYDPEFREEFPYGKPVSVRGMNGFKTLKDRREITEDIIENEIALCLEGFNHFTKTFIGSEECDYEIDPNTPFIKALWKVSTLLNVAKCTLGGVENSIRHIERAARKLRLHERPISEIKRRNIKACLDLVEKSEDKPSNYRYNKNRAHLHMLFKTLVEYETIETNIIRDISKRVQEKKQREVLTLEEFRKIAKYLESNHYDFYRYCMIFFHAGIRATELFSVKKKHVNLSKQEYQVYIKKGKLYIWETKIIILPAIPYWKEIIDLCESEDNYLFSKKLLPGKGKSHDKKASEYWRRHVKNTLGITADFYTMKHLFLDLVDEKNNTDFDAAKEMANHRSSTITDVYRTGKKKREREVLKNLNVSL